MHLLLFTARLPTEVAGVLLSAILGTRYFEGREIHMRHHRWTEQPQDPNEFWHTMENREPGWPTLKFFLSQVLGARLLQLLCTLASRLTPPPQVSFLRWPQSRVWQRDLLGTPRAICWH